MFMIKIIYISSFINSPAELGKQKKLCDPCFTPYFKEHNYQIS